jgi:tetratricopeptide (TPR) repeat protein
MTTQLSPIELARRICTDGITLTAQGKTDEALEKYDQVVAEFGLRRKPEFLRVVATALYNKGTVLGTLDRSEEAVSAYDQITKRFGQSTEITLAPFVVKAMRNKAYRLNALGMGDESAATYEALVAQFGNSTDPEIEAAVAPVRAFLGERQAAIDTRNQTTRA